MPVRRHPAARATRQGPLGAFKNGRIRHWLAATDPNYTHWETLSVQQDPSPDGTTEGQITWYDYAGKPASVNYETGTQIRASVIARVMPDGTTWYRYYTRLTNGLPTHLTEAWLDGGSVFTRSEAWAYAANHVDLLAWTNALNVLALSNVFNAYHQVTTNYDALGQKTTYAYDGTTHQITNATYASGLVTTYSYDGNHRLQQATDSPINSTKSYTWNSDGTVLSFTDARGMTVTNFWDGLHRLTGVRYPDGTTTSNLYSRGSAFPNGTGGLNILDLTASKDRMGFWTFYDYDALRRRVAVTNANAVVSRYGYCDCGAESYITNAWNTTVQQVTIYNYDNQGNRTTENYADGYNVTNWFDSLRRRTVTGDGTGYRWLFYDNLGRLTTVSNAYGAEQFTTYDVLNRPVYVTDANGVTITNTYDDLSRLITRGYPDGGVEKFGYSARGLIAYTNQLGATNFFGYDELARKTVETNANAQIIRYTNNAAGDLLSLTDGKSHTTRWNYDEYGRVTNKLDQAGAVILKYTYDPDSRLTNRWSSAKGNTKYAYDSMANLTNIDYPVSTDVRLQYDALNRLIKMVDAVGTNTYSYTAAGQLLTEDGPFASDTVTNTYANRLRTRLDLQQPSGLWTNVFAYDAACRLTNVVSPAGAFGYHYAVRTGSTPSLISWLSLPNTACITNTFDSVARLTATYLENSSGSTLDSAVYGYDLASQRIAYTNAAEAYYLYSYDPIGQLTIADSVTNSEDRGYFYDAAWNLNRRTNNGASSTFSVDTKNQLTADPSYTDSYDANGNLTQRNSGSFNVYQYTYDDENRLVSILNDNGLAPQSAWWQTDFVYDGLGRLRKRIEYAYWTGTGWLYTNATVSYIYDGLRVIQERDYVTNSPLVSYTRGLDLSGTLEGAGGIGGLLARSHNYSGGNWSTHNLYHADGNGNITYLVNSSQTLAASYRYDPYGNLLLKSGTLADANVYRFSSKEIHVTSGMYYYLYRFYDPNLQRWINRDPLSDFSPSVGLALSFAGSGSYTVREPFMLRMGKRGAATPPTQTVPYDLQFIDRVEIVKPNLFTFCANQPLPLVDPLGLWYIDLNITGGFILGLTGGVQIGPGGIHFYGGGGVVSPGVGGSIHWSPQDPSPGQFSQQFDIDAGLSGAVGKDFSGSPFWEAGLGGPFGFSYTCYYTF